MIEYLESLAANKEYQKALAYAEDLLRNHENSVEDLLRIYLVMYKARYFASDYEGAVKAGLLLRTIAEQTDHWDKYAEACINVSAAYILLEQYEEGMHLLYEYLENLYRYESAIEFEALALMNIGKIQTKLGDDSSAENAWLQGLQAATRRHNERQAFAIRMALIELYLRTGKLQSVPRQIAKCAHFLRNNPGADLIAGGRLHLVKFRATHALATGRLTRAKLVALHGCSASDNYPSLYELHMLLASVAEKAGEKLEAVAHGESARTYAALCRRPDLEHDSAQFVYRLTKNGEVPLQSLDKHFLELN